MKIAKYLGRDAGHHLLGQPDEERLWSSLLPVVSADFVAGWVDAWWEYFLSDEKTGRPPLQVIENVLSSAIDSVGGASITLVIRLLRLLPEISEAKFQGWMINEGFSWDTGDYELLASLLLERRWRGAVKEMRYSWKRELKLVAWHARDLLSRSDRFRKPPEDVGHAVRVTNHSTLTSSMLPKKKMKILFLASNPMSSNRMALDEEARSIEEKMLGTKHSDSVIFRPRWAVRATDLQHAILEDEPTIVHFSGHGGGDIGILMHSSNQDEETIVSSEALADLFRVLKNGIRVVVLNACYSEVQAKAINEHIDFVVGMSNFIGDVAARVFAAAFYRGLSFGKPVQTAFDLGLNEMHLAGLCEERQIPQLLVREGASAATAILVSDF